MQNRMIELEKELRLQQNSKENLLKVSLKDTKNGVASSKNILTSYKSIGLTNGGRSQLFKSQRNLRESTAHEDNTIAEQSKMNDTSRNQD